MLIDILKELLPKLGTGSYYPSSEQDIQTPDQMMKNKAVNSDPNNIYDDSGKLVDYSTNNPFAKLGDMVKTSRAGDNTGPSVLRQLLSSVLGGGIVPGTGTVGGDPAGVAGPTHTPGTKQDAALNPTPMTQQKQPNLSPVPLSQPRPDYSQPSALDPNAIEELRRSLLSDSGQLDPNNPNGLAGRMTGPNSQVDMNNQRKETQSMEDSLRGFDGSRQAKIKKGNQL